MRIQLIRNIFRSPADLGPVCPTFLEEKCAPLPTGAVRELSLILKELRVITDKIKHQEAATDIVCDWKFAAMVLDRLCLILFTFFTVIATVVLLTTAPHVIVT